MAFSRSRLACFCLPHLALGLVAVPTLAQDQEQEQQAEPAVSAADDVFAGRAPANVEELRAMQDRIQELSENIMDATVGIRVGGSQGSGVIVSEDGYVLTAAHVVSRAGRRLTFILQDGSEVQGRSLGLNHRIDSGLCKIEGDGPYPHVEMGDSSTLGLGQWVLSAGHPGGYERGRRPVIRVGRLIDAQATVVRSDCTLVGGDSGGPLFDMNGNLIGIHSRIGSSLTANMHVPVDTYRYCWERMVAAETWGEQDEPSPFVGIVGGEASGPPEVQDVRRRSPAADAGLEEGDLILSIDGFEVSNLMQVMTYVSGCKGGDELTLLVQRGEEEVELTLEIGDRR